MIEITNLTFDYPGHRALDDVTLTVASGSVTALVGPNGAGKTTLMRCIAGLETPLTGNITVDGTDVIEHPREVHRVMGYLSDFFGLYQDLSIARCLEYAAAAQGLPETEIPAAVARTAERLDLSDKLQQPSGSLSRGQRQRVAIGQAIIHQPKVLLLDEPASGLDPEARASLAALFRQLQADGMTLLVSSHILAELDEYSTHMLALRNGRILENRTLKSAHHADEHRLLHLDLAQPDARLPEWLRNHTQLELLPPGRGKVGMGVESLSGTVSTPTLALPLHGGGNEGESCSLVLKAATESHAEFYFRGDLHAQAALLKALVHEGFAVSSLAAHKENLQQSYLRSVAAHLENQA